MKQITVRLEDDLHRKVKVRAAQEGVTLNDLGILWFMQYAADQTIVGLTFERGLGAGVPEGGAGEAQRSPGTGSGHVAEAGEAETDAGLIAARTESSRDTPAPSPRKCSREARHHINHGGKPCPECGWPT